ncbi:MAG: translation initiation factor IF-6 [Thermoplasmata archaeon]
MLRLGDVNGNPYVGVYCAASENLAIVPDTAEPKAIREIARALEVDVVTTVIGGATVVGSLVAMNSNGAVVTNFAERNELVRLPKALRVAKMEEKLNAAGNNILVNDRAALVHPATSNQMLRLIADVLGVEARRGKVAGIDTVGSACIVTSKGLLCHPRTTEAELRDLSEFFKVPAKVATLNYGTPYLGACAVANSKGAFIGSRSTPIEIGRLEDGLRLY